MKSPLFPVLIGVCLAVAHGRCPNLARPDDPAPTYKKKPVVRNNIVYHLNTKDYQLVPKKCTEPCEPDVIQYKFGGIVKDNKALIKRDSPHIIQGNIEIAPSGCLYIEPGTELQFGPGYGLIVNGTLIARGSNDDDNVTDSHVNPLWIKFTKHSTQPASKWPTDARLVDGNTTRDGRMELLYLGKWRGICTNYQNYTKIDANVTCRHLGFYQGNFTYHSYSRNFTEYMVYESPRCLGHENSLFDCPGAKSITMGKHVCDGQQVIGFSCAGLRSDLAEHYWRGIEFINSTIKLRYYSHYQNIAFFETLSMLEYVIIEYAGNDNALDAIKGLRHPLASLSASPYAPVLNYVTIRHGAYDAINMTDMHGTVHIANSTITNNRGHGARIETASGRVVFNNSDISDNWGDGVKVYMSNYTFNNYEAKFPFDKSLEKAPILSIAQYPMFVHQDGKYFKANEKPELSHWQTSKEFTAQKLQRITVHTLLLERDPSTWGTIEIRDKSSVGKHLVTINIANGSYPESVTSTRNQLWMRFTWKPTRDCPKFRPCLRFLLELTVSNETNSYHEFQMVNSRVSHNNGYGVNVQDMRYMVSFNRSVIEDNQYGAGIRIYQGAGTAIFNATNIMRNDLCGANISYAGGYIFVNNSNIIANRGYGVLTSHVLMNKTRFELRHEMDVIRSEFSLNEMIALRIGNYCRDATYMPNNTRMFVNIIESNFKNNFDEAVEYLSCNVSGHIAKDMRDLTFRYNNFIANRKHAIIMKPFLNTMGIMTNNTFVNHPLCVLRIDNEYDLLVSRWYVNFPVKYYIIHNTFKENSGLYVISVRLTQGSPLQNIRIKYNTLTGNLIQEPFKWIMPRSRAAGVVILSSTNAIFQRNHISNPESVRELSTQLIDPAAEINAAKNWWGTENRTAIFNSIFDQNDRFNLAMINHYPSLITRELYDNAFNDLKGKYRAPFVRGNKIGGILREFDQFRPDQRIKTYYVDRDILVEDEAVLEFPHGTTLKFPSSVGIIVHGVIYIRGRKNSKIRFTLDDEYVLPVENRTASVSLVDGADEYEGRLEVVINGQRGTVCKEGWTETNALLVCQQLGLAYHPRYSQPSQKRASSNESLPVLISNVACTDLDTDLAACTAERDHTCTHADDVFLRCQPLTWAGIVLSARSKHSKRTNKITTIEHVDIEKAGLLDAALMSYTAGLRIDYNSFVIQYLTVKHSVADGIHINFNNPFQESRLERCDVSNNQGNGILTRSSFLEIFYTKSNDNDLAGFKFDPFFTEYDSLTIRNFISKNLLIEMTDPKKTSVFVEKDGMVFLVAGSKKAEDDSSYYFVVEVDSSYLIAIEVLDYNPVSSVENVTILDGLSNSHRRRWEIEKDLVDFPVLSSSNKVTIKYTVKGIQSGRFTFIAHSWPIGNVINDAKVYLRNCTFKGNYQGIVTRHYNNPSNRRNELYFRHKKEIFEFLEVNVLNSKGEAMHVPSVTKFHDDYVPTFEEMTRPQKLAEIMYNVQFSRFTNNGRGLLAEHNHVDFANNVWQWNISKCNMLHNSAGGLEIELPRINEDSEQPTVKKHHSVSIVDTAMSDNEYFSFAIAGYYATVTIVQNQFRNNKCRFGLMSIKGMEKMITIKGNEFSRNEAMYIVDLDLSSHSEFSMEVVGKIFMNSLQDNYSPVGYKPRDAYQSETYAVALRGIEKFIVNHNIFQNEYAYELIAGIMSLRLEYEIDVTKNWWGTRDQYKIQEKIVDFDDWNKYAIAQYVPFLSQASTELKASVSVQVRSGIPLNLPYIGGRILKSQTLPARSTPYIVRTDLTIMPGAVLRLEPGTVLEFYPNVGILVLGVLEAKGYYYERITFRPASDVKHAIPVRQRRAVKQNVKIRLRNAAKLIKLNQGFLELYNTSTHTHNLMCDEHFNEKTAEVVCRQLGYETVNVKVRFTHLYDHYIFGRPMYFRKEFWYYSYYCRGDEGSLDMCAKRINYNLVKCVQNANYTYVVCGSRNLESKYQYWGNIRFAPNGFEETQTELHFQKERKFSKMENVDIYGGGFLHGEKVGAIQATYNLPATRYINISGCALNGIDYIAPRTDFNASHLNITNNLGYAINVLVLNGESELQSNSYQPLVESTIPYNILGMVPICKMEKAIEFSQRIIVYFKYSHRAVDCLKKITSKNRIALRLLQINLFHETFSRNVLEIFDGRERHEITAFSDRTKTMRTYMSESGLNTITLHMHASPAHWSYGFIAEVVTLPIPRSTYPDDRFKHVITNNVFFQNGEGAIQYQSVGEVSPSVYVEQCWIQNNGFAILNLTSLPTVVLRLQGTRILTFTNSFVAHNKGVMEMNLRKLHSITVTANVTNNVFAFNTNGETMNITGHYAQEVLVYENDIRNNTAGDFRSVINIEGVSMNFTYNILRNNVGHHILSSYNRDDVNNVFQYYTKNVLIDNNCTADLRATMLVARPQTLINSNYFHNPASSFELLSGAKRSRRYQPKLIDATENWWGLSADPYIRGVIQDESDDKELLPVRYKPEKTSPAFFIEERCSPGWRHEKGRCYRYIGAALPYEEAKDYCKMIGGFLADASRVRKYLHYLVYQVQNNPQEDYQIWVLGKVRAGRCSSYHDEFVREQQDCKRLMLPFVCDSDPISSEEKPQSIALAMGLGIAAGVVILLITVVILILVCVKSKKRKKERMERNDFIRSSVRSARSRSLITGLSDKSKNGSVESYLADPRNIHLSSMTNVDMGTDPIKKGSSYHGNDFSPHDTMSSQWENKLMRPGHGRRYENTAYESNHDESQDEDEEYDRKEGMEDLTDDESESGGEDRDGRVSLPYKSSGDSPPPEYRDSPKPNPLPRHITHQRAPNQYGAENEILSLNLSASRDRVLHSNSSMDDRSIDMTSERSRSQRSLDQSPSGYPGSRHTPQPTHSTFFSKPAPTPAARLNLGNPAYPPNKATYRSNPDLLSDKSRNLTYHQPPVYKSQPDLLSHDDDTSLYATLTIDEAQPPPYEERSPPYSSYEAPERQQRHPYYESPPSSLNSHQRPFYPPDDRITISPRPLNIRHNNQQHRRPTMETEI